MYMRIPEAVQSAAYFYLARRAEDESAICAEIDSLTVVFQVCPRSKIRARFTQIGILHMINARSMLRIINSSKLLFVRVFFRSLMPIQHISLRLSHTWEPHRRQLRDYGHIRLVLRLPLLQRVGAVLSAALQSRQVRHVKVSMGGR